MPPQGPGGYGGKPHGPGNYGDKPQTPEGFPGGNYGGKPQKPEGYGGKPQKPGGFPGGTYGGPESNARRKLYATVGEERVYRFSGTGMLLVPGGGMTIIIR